MYIASQLQNQPEQAHVLLIDIGSTTADFVAIQDGQPICQSFTDATRMQTEELVYSGVIRTPLMALSQTITFNDQPTTLAAEYFATMADVYRLTGDLQEADDMADTADGKPKTPLASARRLARMIGRDVEDAPLTDWVELAHAFKRVQLERLSNAAQQHIKRFEDASDVVILGAGAGSFLAAEIAKACNLSYQDSTALLQNLSAANLVSSTNLAHWANVCLPAYAVAFLALHNL
jgi:probable H4MPT-linked C1 transfer pathway protein